MTNQEIQDLIWNAYKEGFEDAEYKAKQYEDLDDLWEESDTRKLWFKYNEQGKL